MVTKADPERKKTRRPARAKNSSAAGTVSAIATAQINQLRKKVEDLKTRLAKEASRRASEVTMLRDAKKARDALSQQMKAFKQQGESLSRQLKKALTDADKREKARQQALSKIAELRSDLARKTDELKRRSGELAKLARESAGRAREIIMGGGPSQPKEPSGEGSPPSEAASPAGEQGSPPREPSDQPKDPQA